MSQKRVSHLLTSLHETIKIDRVMQGRVLSIDLLKIWKLLLKKVIVVPIDLVEALEVRALFKEVLSYTREISVCLTITCSQRLCLDFLQC